MSALDPLSVARVVELDEGALAPLLAAAEAEAHAFVRRLAIDWRSGANRFDRGPGEAYWSLRNGSDWLAAGGLNIDPHAGDPRSGRVRHFYVLPEWRRRGCASALFAEVLSHARPHFDRLLLHTERAAAFWERQGFVRFGDARTHSTHALLLRSR